jgi:hypothetical protein
MQNQLSEKIMKKIFTFLLLLLILLLTGCNAEPVCQSTSEAKQYLTSIDLKALSTPVPSPFPIEVEINGKTMKVDKLVDEALCNDTWRGTVYVGCDVRVFEWKEKPLFLKDCDLHIEPGTVVYVAAHNNEAYYNGCSCHTGEEP